jgi:hypothetical protein
MTQKVYQKYFEKISRNKNIQENEVLVLDENERIAIRKIYQITLLKASILGLLGVVLYFLPIHLFPDLFPFFDMKYLFEFKLEYGQLIFGIVLMILELHLLVLVNLKSVHQLANVTGFYNKSENENQFLLDLGLGSKELGLNNYGINPYQEVNTKLLFFYNLLLKLKGFLANKLLQYLFKRLMGKYAVRYAIDYIGIPIYMFLNALGAYTVLNEAKICILGSNYVKKFINELNIEFLTNDAKDLIYDTLQLIAMSKRDYHKNHYLLTAQLFNKFNIQIVDKKVFTPEYYQKLAQSPFEIQELCKKIIVLGFILDGKISQNETKKIKTLENFGILKFNFNEIKYKCKQFKNGVSFEM